MLVVLCIILTNYIVMNVTTNEPLFISETNYVQTILERVRPCSLVLQIDFNREKCTTSTKHRIGLKFYPRLLKIIITKAFKM